MKITPDQIAILDSFSVTFLCADIDSLLNARDEFYNDFNIMEELV